MKISVVAVGLKIPKWADEACEDYLHRFPSDWKVELKTVKATAGATKDARSLSSSGAPTVSIRDSKPRLTLRFVSLP